MVRRFDCRPHTGRDYSVLLDINDYRGLTPEDERCLDEFGRVLHEADATHLFGASLLHQHFPVVDGERMVELTDFATRVQELTPVRRFDLDAELVPSIVRFDADNPPALIAMEFKPVNSAAPAALCRSDILEALFRVLDSHDRLGRFGLILRQDELELHAGEVLLEVCDPERRRLRCEVIRRDDARLRTSVQTQWFWIPYAQNCNRSCDRTCEQFPVRQCGAFCQPDYSGGHGRGHNAQGGYQHRAGNHQGKHSYY